MTVHLACDLVFMVGGFILALSLWFSVKRNARMPVATTLPTAIVLTGYSVCFVLLGLYLAAFSTALATTFWYILFFKRWIANKQ